MTTSYPGSADSFTNPTSGDNLSTSVGGRTHSAMHADINDAVEAIEAHVLSGAPIAPSVKTSDYTAVLADAGKVIELNKATAIALTIPPASSVSWVTGTVIGVYQAGVGASTVTAGAGVTIRNNAALRGQYAEASLRYRGSDEWVLEGDLATASAPALKDYAEVIRTAGSLTLNSTTMAAVSTSLDLTISAASGDLIEYGITGLLDAGSISCQFDVYTRPSGSDVAPFGAGLPSATGVPAWHVTDEVFTSFQRLGGSATRILDGSDVASGSTVLRLNYKKGNSTARTLYAVATIPLKVWAKNYGQV